jgi:hypothetical protein
MCAPLGLEPVFSWRRSALGALTYLYFTLPSAFGICTRHHLTAASACRRVVVANIALQY